MKIPDENGEKLSYLDWKQVIALFYAKDSSGKLKEESLKHLESDVFPPALDLFEANDIERMELMIKALSDYPDFSFRFYIPLFRKLQTLIAEVHPDHFETLDSVLKTELIDSKIQYGSPSKTQKNIFAYLGDNSLSRVQMTGIDFYYVLETIITDVSPEKLRNGLKEALKSLYLQYHQICSRYRPKY